MAGKRSKIPTPSGKIPEAVSLEFTALVDAIRGVHVQCATQAVKAVNTTLTLRNWLIGCHIHHYELHGTDRATYGEHLLSNLADQLGAAKVSNCDRRQLYRYLRFYRLYPEIVGTLSPQSVALQPPASPLRKAGTPSPQIERSAHKLLSRLSYSRIEQLLEFDDSLQRSFYEVEAQRSNWSVRELKRQIATLYFERSGLSADKDALARLTHAQAETQSVPQVIRDPYVFEFLGLKSKEVMSEGHLEDALLDKLQDFLLELGHGCSFRATKCSCHARTRLPPSCIGPWKSWEAEMSERGKNASAAGTTARMWARTQPTRRFARAVSPIWSGMGQARCAAMLNLLPGNTP